MVAKLACGGSNKTHTFCPDPVFQKLLCVETVENYLSQNPSGIKKSFCLVATREGVQLKAPGLISMSVLMPCIPVVNPNVMINIILIYLTISFLRLFAA